jgi:hypothetical protein
LPARKAREALVFDFRDTARLERALDRLTVKLRWLREKGTFLARIAAEHDGLADGEREVRGGKLCEKTGLARGRAARKARALRHLALVSRVRARGGILRPDREAAAVRKRPRKDAEQGRLPRAVRSDDAEPLALAEGKRDVGKDLAVAVTGGESLGAEQYPRLAHGALLLEVT